MDSWRAHMPKGMQLKSDGFASTISDPTGGLTLAKFCAEQNIRYADTGVPVPIEAFTDYGIAFRERILPQLEEKIVAGIEKTPQGFLVRIDDGEVIPAKRVVLAVGITHFEYVPDALSQLSPEFLSHSGRHSEVGVFSGRRVVVIGGGASASDWAGLLHQAGVDVQLVARQSTLKFHNKPGDQPRSLWSKLKSPQSGLGPGWKSRFYSNAPSLFHRLPESLRLKIVRRALGPAGGWFIKDKVVGKIPLWLGYTVEKVAVVGNQVQLNLRAQDGSERTLLADHIIAATGYKVDVERLKFLSPEIRSQIKTLQKAPVVSLQFESSVPGLYFAGVSAANSFGPLMRFAYGSEFSARTIARVLSKSMVREPENEPARRAMTAAK